MSLIHRIRTYHVALAVLTVTSYVTGELGRVHTWLGYGVASVLAFRIIWGAVGNRQVGLARFYPNFDGLKLDTSLTHPAISRTLILGILLSLLFIVVTGIALDRNPAVEAVASADVDAAALEARRDESDGGEAEHGSEFLEEGHEAAANVLLLIVGAHIAYLVIFRRPLARFMLFRERSRPTNRV